MVLDDYLELELIRGLRNIFEDNIQKIILYGSAARKENTAESDIDIAIILKHRIDPEKREEFLVWSAELDMKYETVISIIDIEEDKIMQWGEVLPFYRNLQNEGIVLWKIA